MNRVRRNRPKSPSPNASAYDLSAPAGEALPPERIPRVGAWLGLSGAILTIASMFLPWTSGGGELGWDTPMMLLFTSAFISPVMMLAGAIAIGVVCGRVTRYDSSIAPTVRSANVAHTLAIMGAAVLVLRILGQFTNVFRTGIEDLGVGAFFFVIGATLAVVGIFGAIYKHY